MWMVRTASATTAVLSMGTAVHGSLNTDAITADFRAESVALCIIASVLLMVRCHARSMGDVFEQGRIQGRREVIAEMNRERRFTPDPIPLAPHRAVRRRPVRVY